MDAANCSLFSNWCLTSLCTTCLKMFTISMRISAHECRKLFSIIQEMFDRFVPYLSQHFHLKYVNLCAWMPQTVSRRYLTSLCATCFKQFLLLYAWMPQTVIYCPGDGLHVYELHSSYVHGCRKMFSILQDMFYKFMSYILPMRMDAANCSPIDV